MDDLSHMFTRKTNKPQETWYSVHNSVCLFIGFPACVILLKGACFIKPLQLKCFFSPSCWSSLNPFETTSGASVRSSHIFWNPVVTPVNPPLLNLCFQMKSCLTGDAPHYGADIYQRDDPMFGKIQPALHDHHLKCCCCLMTAFSAALHINKQLFCRGAGVDKEVTCCWGYRDTRFTWCLFFLLNIRDKRRSSIQWLTTSDVVVQSDIDFYV